jgi:hypothetical protein
VSEIPKRPETPAAGYGAGKAWERFFSKMAEHEHAVAEMAVESIKKHRHECESGLPPAFADISKCPGCNALKEIEASGWKP